MKRNPTLEEKKLLKSLGLRPEEWLVRKHTPELMAIRHKHTDTNKIIPASMLQ